MTEITADRLQTIKHHTEDIIAHLKLIIVLLRDRPIEADFFQGMINRIKSEQKRVCRQIARERADGKV